MKIGIAVPTLGFMGGLERYAFDLAGSLRARGHTLTLLYGERRGRDIEQYTENFSCALPMRDARRATLDVVYVQKATSVEALTSLQGVPVAIAAHDHDHTCARSHRYLPLTHTPCHRAPGLGCVLRGCSVVKDKGAPLSVSWKSPLKLRSSLLELAARGPMIACSNYIAQRLLEAGVPRQRVRVVYPISPAAPTRPTQPTSTTRLVAVGQLLYGKGFDLLIDALRHLPQEVTLDLVGDGPSRAALEMQAARVAPRRVRFAGYVSPELINAYYDRASIVVVPSRWPEPFGMIGVEAMRRARPVVGANHGGIPEWLVPGAGSLFTPGDVVSLSEAILAVMYHKNAHASAYQASKQFQHQDTVSKIEALLTSLI